MITSLLHLYALRKALLCLQDTRPQKIQGLGIVLDVMPAPRPCGGTLLALDDQRIIVSDEGLDGTIGLGHFTFEGFGSSHNRVVITESQ